MTVGLLPRTLLATLPTPLHLAPRLSEELGVEIWLKRDDLTGLGLGGNKARPLEFLIGAAESERADAFVTGGGPQSNWLMLAALAAVSRGMTAHLSVYGHPVRATGNLALISGLPGVEVSFTGSPDRTSVDSAIEDTAARLIAAGSRPFAVGRGGANAIGAFGYLLATAEIDDQLSSASAEPETLWLATGSGGTQAGLVAGHHFSPAARQVIGVTVSRPAEECRERVATISAEALKLSGREPVREVGWQIRDDQLGRYGAPSVAGKAAADLVARTEGVFLDPVFAAKAMASLIAAVRSEEVGRAVLLLVTGGAPTLFSNAEDE